MCDGKGDVNAADVITMRADDSRLLGIPRSRSIIAMIYPYHDARSTDYPGRETTGTQLKCLLLARYGAKCHVCLKVVLIYIRMS